MIAHWRKTKSCPCRGKSSLKKVNFISSTSLSISYFVWRKFYDSCVDLIISWWFYFLLMLNANRLTIKMCKEVLAQNPTIMILKHNKIGFHLSTSLSWSKLSNQFNAVATLFQTFGSSFYSTLFTRMQFRSATFKVR